MDRRDGTPPHAATVPASVPLKDQAAPRAIAPPSRGMSHHRQGCPRWLNSGGFREDLLVLGSWRFFRRSSFRERDVRPRAGHACGQMRERWKCAPTGFQTLTYGRPRAVTYSF